MAEKEAPEFVIEISPEEGNEPSGGGGGVSPEEARRRQMEAIFNQRYFQLWGVLPPPGYAERFIGAGLNVFEFEEQERMKPAFRRTETYRREASRWADMLNGIMGRG